MRFNYTIDPNKRIVFQRYEGTCTAANMKECIHRLWSDQAYSSSFGCYIDLTNVKAPAALEDLNQLIEFLRGDPRTTEGRCAAVTNSPILTACGVLYQKAMTGRHAFSVFSSPEAALAFLQTEGPPPDWQTEPGTEFIA